MKGQGLCSKAKDIIPAVKAGFFGHKPNGNAGAGDRKPSPCRCLVCVIVNDASPTQVYRAPTGDLLLYVRNETREHKGEGVLLVGARDRVVYTIFVPEGEALPGELVNDTAGREEAVVARFDREELSLDKAALAQTMKKALEWLSPSQGEELRTFYTAVRGDSTALASLAGAMR